MTGVLAFLAFLAGGGTLWASARYDDGFWATGGAASLGWGLLALGFAAVVATAMLTLNATRPEPRSPR
ncbi:hypothetical protein OJ997_10495 [Solirubrobacter phytolaccae]|uniref:Uncharacterized protein n=1 Tax=Solirubrobacter phytolaccae TaxID=1404360 RepID=A0A9X3SET3_9ACTN|nr:hypothetical protein [Solirubrobacter phytolaccae]MDA0180722.1 hypothetical protein [Solirubrobacter phytolaccae]